jgi:hypothetical protein
MAKPRKNGKSEPTAADKLVAAEKKLDDFIKNSSNGKKILDETKEIEEGLHNINPLAIGHQHQHEQHKGEHKTQTPVAAS